MVKRKYIGSPINIPAHWPSGRVFANGSGDLCSIPGLNQRLKMVLDTSLLNTQKYKVRIEVKWSSPGKGFAPSPTPRCTKGSLLVTLDYGH